LRTLERLHKLNHFVTLHDILTEFEVFRLWQNQTDKKLPSDNGKNNAKFIHYRMRKIEAQINEEVFASV
jgi:hypothetical protein